MIILFANLAHHTLSSFDNQEFRGGGDFVFEIFLVNVISISDGEELERFTASKDDVIRQKIQTHF